MHSPFSVLVNGSPSEFFSSSRGIRQGDPLSPYIFSYGVLVYSYGLISSIRQIISPKRTRVDKVSHLLFANDMLIFCKADRDSIKELNHLLELLHNLHLNIELTINRGKSKFFLCKGCKLREELSSIIGIVIGHLPIKYLRQPLSHNYLKSQRFWISSWQVQGPN